MKDYLEKRRAELKKRGNMGFTLVEMLIVVAIIAVLIAIAIPVFMAQLEKSRDATTVANLRCRLQQMLDAVVQIGTTCLAKLSNQGIVRQALSVGVCVMLHGNGCGLSPRIVIETAI